MVAVDGSAPALKGVWHAARIAQGLGATLELVYVSFPNLLPPHAYPKAYAQIEETEAENAKKILDAAERSVSDMNLEFIKTHRVGAAAEEIAAIADRPEVWCVVVGATGHNAVSRVLLGSVADRLVHICSKPVLVVR